MKCDVLTGFIEFSAICKIPMSFAIGRGQGIKLLSFIAYKCAKQKILMPDLDKSQGNQGYEGAICLPPKRGFYSDNPIAVNDYSSLYPSCMVSENISHDSKVWTKEYDLKDRMIKDTGKKDEGGNYIYDNLSGYKYVDIRFDTYIYIRKSLKGAAVKELSGYKICRYIQFNDGKQAVMPGVLTELLAARKATKKLKKDAKDPFMKSVYDKRQAGIKVVANSLYGQCGAKTSSFYDIDIAASTTATGRKLLMYAKRIIEDCYSGITVDTKYGKMKPTAEAIYGDSVPGDEPLILRDENGLVTIKTIKSLSNNWEQYENFKPFDTVQSNRREKQKAFVKYEVWAKDKWNPIKKVIRHKTNKKIYRVNTHCGVVDVTEDHSLMSDKFEKIKPEDCVIGETKLSHTFPIEFLENECFVKEYGEEKIIDKTLYECSGCKEKYNREFYYDTGQGYRANKCKLCKKKQFCKRTGQEFNGKLNRKLLNIHTKKYKITEDEARVWGMFMGDGSCGKYNCPSSGIKHSWGLNNATIERLYYYKDILEKIEPIKFKVLDTLESSGVYKLVPLGSIKYMVDKYRPLFYDENKAKLVPDCILNAPLNIRKAFFEGYYDADGAKTHDCGINKTLSFITKNKITAQCLYYLATSIGYNKLSINYKTNNGNNYYTIRSCKKWGKPPNVLKKMVYLRNSEEEYVYDLETEHGVFACGVGKIEIFNTDSVFFSFNLKDMSGNKVVGKKALDVTIKLAKEAGELATKYLKVPHDLEYEKTFMPFLLLAKKKYVGMLYENDINYCKRKSMGIVLKRRDNAPCVKDSYGGVVDILMNKCDADEAVNFIKIYLDNMINEKIPMNKLIITKKLNSYYKNPKQIAHKVLADRMGDRDPGNKPSVGSRLPFIYIKTKKKMKLQGDRIEHPDYIEKNKLKPDYEHYITNQIMKPLLQLFGLLLEQLKIFRKQKRMYRIKINGIKREWENDEKKCHDKIAKESDKRIKKLIFDEYINVYRNKVVGQKSINKFFQKVK